MKKFISVFTITLLAISLAGCGVATDNQTTGSKDNTEVVVDDNNENNVEDLLEQDQKLKVYTSFYPMYDFTVKIGGDKIEVNNMVPTGTEPHDWEPAATDIVNLENADMLIYHGVGMEHWVEQVITSLENDNLILVEASTGIDLLEGGHSHDDEEEYEDEEEEHEDEEETGYDPHVWLSIKRAKQEMENIKNALVNADPKNTEYYEDNYEVYAAKFDELDAKFTDTLSGLVNKDIVVAHQAFAYLCKDYGLNQVAIEGLSAESEPDAKRMAEIIDFSRENNIKTIFFEELVSPKVAEAIASEIGAKTDVLNPIEGLTQEQINAGGDYLSVMEDNLEALVRALE